GGKGIICHKLNEKTGVLAGMCAVEESDDVMLITDGGMLIRIPVSQVSTTGRSTSGVIVMRMANDSRIANFQRIVNEEEAEKCEEPDADETEEGLEVLMAEDENEDEN
ncbi:MAG TPA: DNA gyrase subunit A, partial [Clostridiales bacterium]|nr:DNA gyrase subunit A [Clostridiales bacterium]